MIGLPTGQPLTDRVSACTVGVAAGDGAVA